LSIAFRLLSALLAATPILAIANGGYAQHGVALAAAIMLVVTAMGPQAEIATTAQLLKRFSLAILFPILWMVLQTVPLPFASLVNPIWSTTAIALNEPSLAGFISLDPGATFRSLISYLVALSLVVSTVIITKDRYRARTILLVLSVVTTFMSVEVLIGQLDSFAGMIPSAGTPPASTFAATAALAALTNGAIIVMAIEGHLHQPDAGNLFSGPLLFRVFLGLSGIAVSFAAMRALAQGSLFAAVGLGFFVILFVAVVRRLGARTWTSAILFAILVAVTSAMALPRLQLGQSAELLGFVTLAAPDSVVLAQRALSDASWVGSGVGTFELLSKIYQDFGAKPIAIPPSTAVSIAIEWGRPALLILIGFAVQLFFFTFRGAVRRGRDSFFASAAAAAIAVVICEGFLDSSLLNPAVQIIIAVMIGLGLSQTAGRTSGLES
jgi:hypothetical protein